MMNSLQLKFLAKQYHLDLLILFGSQASGRKNHLSDIDLAFYRLRPLSDEEETGLYSSLMAFYKRNDIDLINISQAHSALLRYQIFMTGNPLYESRRGLFGHMRWQAYFDFEDFKRFYSQKNDLLDKKLAALT